MLAIHVGAVLSHVHVAAAWVVQEGGGAMATDPLGLWKAMGWVARTVVIILFIMFASRHHIRCRKLRQSIRATSTLKHSSNQKGLQARQ